MDRNDNEKEARSQYKKAKTKISEYNNKNAQTEFDI